MTYLTRITKSTPSTSVTTGAFISDGGAGFAGDLNVGSTAKIAGTVSILNTTSSTNTTTGAVTIGGGIGIKENVCVGGYAKITGTVLISDSSAATNAVSGALKVTGGIGCGGNSYFSGQLTISNSTASTNTTSGALTLAGGLGVGGDINVGGATALAGTLKISNASSSTNSITGALTIVGGVGIGENLNVGGTVKVANNTTLVGTLNVINTTSSTNTTTGSAVFNGGLGLAENLNVGGTAKITGTSTLVGAVNITNSTASTNSITGALTISGGIGASGNVNIGGNTKITGTTTSIGVLSVTNTTGSTSTTTGSAVFNGGLGLAENLNVGGATKVTGSTTLVGLTSVTNSTTSSNYSSGALTIVGGVGIGDNLHIKNPLTTDSGGTGLGSIYTKGDLLVATSSSTLVNQAVGAYNGQLLLVNSAKSTGVEWSYGVFNHYLDVDDPMYINTTQYYINYGYGVNQAKTDIIQIPSKQVLDLSTTGANGIGVSSTLSGTFYHMGANVVGTGTSFTTDFVSGDVIYSNGIGRKITTISSNTSMTTQSSFGLLNDWSSGGSAAISTTRAMFGSSSALFSNVTGTTLNVTMGSYNSNNITPANWTIELWYYPTSTAGSCGIFQSTIPNTLRLMRAGAKLALYMGDGTAYQLSNQQNSTNMANNTWHHIAMSFDGTAYRVFLDGSLTNGITVTTSTSLISSTFNGFNFATNGTNILIGSLDEIRISNIARYTANFTPTTSAFTMDSNTMLLNHFEGTNGSTNFAISDDSILAATLSYRRGGLAPNTHYYIYMLGHSTTPKYLLSTRSTETGESIIDVPSGYSSDNIRHTKQTLMTKSDTTLYYIGWDSMVAVVFGLQTIATITSTTITTFDLSQWFPKNIGVARLNCVLVNLDTNNSITIGPNATIGYETVCRTFSNGTNTQNVVVPLSTSQSLDIAITSAVTNGSYALIQLEGFILE